MENKIQSQMRKWILDFLILGILKKWETYWAEIIVVEWTVYPLLSRLIKDSMISYYWVESDSWHPRKYFKLTKSGEDAFDLMWKSWSEIKNTVQKILEK